MSMTKIFLLALSLWLVISPSAHAQKAAVDGKPHVHVATPQDADLTKRLDKINALVNERMKTLNLPAYALTVIKGGEIVLHEAYGYADVEKQKKATTDTIFGIGSLTKTFTAVILLMLADESIVNLDAPLAKYIPDLTKPYQRLTVRQLAAMTAGVPATVSKEVRWVNQLSILDHTPLAAEPGSQYLYSNFSYRLLGSVISNVTGGDYHDVLKTIILDNFKMKGTGTTTSLEATGRVAQGYTDDLGKGTLRPIAYKDPAITYSSGGLASTADDLAVYVLALLSGELVSEPSYKAMWYERPPLSTGKPSGWSFGWWAGKPGYLNGQFSVSMQGGIPGVASSIVIIPRTDSAVIALCNLRKPQVYEIARSVARLAFGDNKSTPAEAADQDQDQSEE